MQGLIERRKKRILCPIGDQNDFIFTMQRQYSECGAAPMLFEEDDTYWEPASDANELYKQLSAKKYREIVRQQIQYVIIKLMSQYLINVSTSHSQIK